MWKDDGATSMAAWLTARLGLAYSSASQWGRMAHDLQSLPALSAAYGEGRLSWDQLVAVVAMANVETDEALANEAPARSASQLQAAARQARLINDKEVSEAHRSRFLRWR